ncbi:hypothetical protein ABZZ79_05990 [Streptomyces sp. NPDC006458]|uniref:hypothetical protein n=1 Tax=Streptomyces sp. NPDC006458 TaxID=3154302 RepID=UPI0033A29E4E
MTDTDLSAQDALAALRIHTDGDVGDEELTYIRAKVGAALARPGLSSVSGRVTVTRDAAHHVRLPWAAGAEIRLGGHLIVVHAREADAHALADRIEDRLRARVERAAHRAEQIRRSAAPPPWRGGAGQAGPPPTEGPSPTEDLSPTEGPSPAA